jgi:hypothetical protein
MVLWVLDGAAEGQGLAKMGCERGWDGMGRDGTGRDGMGWRRIWTCGSEATQEGAHNRKLGALHCLCGYITMYNLSSSHLIESDTIGRFGAALACSGIEVPSIDRRKVPIGRTVPSLGLSTLTQPSYSRLPPSHTALGLASLAQARAHSTEVPTRVNAHTHTHTRAHASAHVHTRTHARARTRARARKCAFRSGR